MVGRRPDGYHLIQSAMQLIDLADDVTITVRADGRIVRDGDVPGVDEDDDLSIRAARMLQAASGTDAGATIGIVKRIPMGGGLGGGSSDAATTLLALNRLWRLAWPRERLMELGARLGADVPFFLHGTNALAEGIGERLTAIALPPVAFAVVHPGVSVPTAAIFTAPELTRDAEVLKISDFSANGFGLSSAPPAGEGSGVVFRNDLEPVAVSRFGAVGEARSWLARDADGASGAARMSGSGACVFRVFDDVSDAARRIASLPAHWTGWSVRSLAVHPHADCADR